MYKNELIVCSQGNTLFPQISKPYLTDKSGKKDLPEEVIITVTDPEDKFIVVALPVAVAVKLSDMLLQLSGEILCNRVREESNLDQVSVFPVV
ncbi:MAG: hypothetical protein WCH34_16580 [Bacteroidota bacterium]